MAQVIIPNDIVEQILVKQDVKDLISYKPVCKSWHSLISKSRFVKSHLHNSKNKERRIDRTAWMFYDVSNLYEVHDFTYVVGSSNGLVCISDYNREFFVFNPSTREVKKVTNPDFCEVKMELYCMDDEPEILCMGFGYDSSIDDYKVVLGFAAYNRNTRFLVLNLKSNVWRVIEEIDYSFLERKNAVGTLCNGKLYWFMMDEYDKEVRLIEFDLSKEEFSEISQPDSAGYKFTKHLRLGIINDCLCIFQSSGPKFEKWVLKNNDIDVGEYWKQLDDDFSSYLQTDWTYSYNRYRSSIKDPNIWMSTTWEDTGVRNNFNVWFLTNSEDIGAPIYVESLVSPHGNGRKKRKIQDSNESRKVARL